MSLGHPSVDKNKAVHAGRGHEGKEFSQLETVKSINIEIGDPKVICRSRLPVVGEFERVGLKGEVILQGLRPKRGTVCGRSAHVGERRIKRDEAGRNGRSQWEGPEKRSRSASDVAPGV